MAALEDGVGAIATASGQAALHLAIATLLGQGGHVVASASLYGGSHNLLSYTLPRFGISTTFVPARDPEAWARAITPATRLLFGESVGNPSVDVLDIPALGALAEQRHIPLLVDATVTTPALGRPFEQGAHLVMHSATKFLSGHGVVIGGVLVDGGRFDWAADDRYPDALAAVRRLSRHGVRGGVEHVGIPAARTARGPARLRRVHGADDRVPGPAGAGDAAAAHGAAHREHVAGRGLPRRPCRRGARAPSRGGGPSRPRARCAPLSTGLPARSSPSSSTAGARRGASSSRRSGSSRTSPTSATRSRW